MKLSGSSSAPRDRPEMQHGQKGKSDVRKQKCIRLVWGDETGIEGDKMGILTDTNCLVT